jgi:hypothetical protein
MSKLKEIVLRNGILKTTKDIEVFKTFVVVHDTTSGWVCYKVPKQLYNKFSAGKIDYWDMVFDKKVKSW